jgi:alpha-galactosidase
MTHRWLRIDGSSSTIILECVNKGVPLWRYWGPKLRADVKPPSLGQVTPPASFSLDARPQLNVFPTNGFGWFGAPALRAHRDGADSAQLFSTEDVRCDERSLSIILCDRVAALSVTLSFAFEGNALRATTALTNEGDRPLSIDWIAAATLPLPANTIHRQAFTGRHNGEFVLHNERMTQAGWHQENRRGLTGHSGPAAAFVETTTGTIYAAQLAWSGNAIQTIEWNDEGHFVWQFGEGFTPGEIMLSPGETHSTPDVIATYAFSMNSAAQAFHAAIRARSPWPDSRMRPRPVHINSWEAFYFDHDEARLMAFADRAASLGVERLVLDDGWFKGRHNDMSGLGDWTPDPDKYPNGLKPLADHVTALGMEFGLWVEPEMVNEDSDLFRAHPEWALQAADRSRPTARNQLVLNMARDDVRDALFKAIDDLLNAVPIRYLKWDHNRDLAPPGGRAQILGAYALIDRVRAAHPHIEIEICAGGGGRIDAGIAERCHRFWASDNLDANVRLPLQRNILRLIPPELMGAHVGTSPTHATSRMQSMAYRCAVALSGHFGIEMDPATLDDNDRAVLSDWIALYKDLRDRLHQGNVWQGTANDGIVWQAHGDAQRLLLLVYREAPETWRTPSALTLSMLDATKRYLIRHLKSTVSTTHSPAQADFWCDVQHKGQSLDGEWLMHIGLPLPSMNAENALVLDIAIDC